MPAALAMVLLILGSFADHLLSEHTPFIVTLYVRTTGEKDCAEYPQHTSRTDAESACRRRPRSLEWPYADADSEMTAVWAWSGAAGARCRYPQARDEASTCLLSRWTRERREPASYFFAVDWESLVCRASIEGRHRLGTTTPHFT
ncbi:hypothetical protein B0H13DRAFT_2071610, partial [Mycena leptocephala]